MKVLMLFLFFFVLFSNANTSNACVGCSLENDSYVDMDLSNYDLSKSNISNSSFLNCDFKNTSFEGANLTNTIIKQSIIKDCNFQDSNVTNLIIINSIVELNQCEFLESNGAVLKNVICK